MDPNKAGNGDIEFYVVPDRSAYLDILPTKRLEDIYAASQFDSAIELVADALSLNWRSAAYLAQVPSTLIHKSWETGRWEYHEDDECLLTHAEMFVQGLASRIVDMELSPSTRTSLLKACLDIAAEYCAKKPLIEKEMLDSTFAQMVHTHPFGMYVWYSQAAAFLFTFATYEHFVIQIANCIDPNASISARGRDLNKQLIRVYGESLTGQVWTGPQVSLWRLVRNALAHNASYETPELKDIEHSYTVQGGLLSITISDNRTLFEELHRRVMKILKFAKGKLSI